MICNAFPIYIVHQISQALVHALHQGSILRLFMRKPFIHILLIETFVCPKRRMHGIMTHIEEKRFRLVKSLIHKPFCLQCQSLSKESICSMILFQIGHSPYRCPFRLAGSTISFFSQIAPHSTGCMTGYVIIEADSQWIGSRCIYRTEMSFTYHHGSISVFTKQLWQALRIKRMFQPGFRTQTIIIPCFKIQHLIFPVGRCIFLQRPVRYFMPGGVCSRKQADT